MEFDAIDGETGKQTEWDEDDGQYAKTDVDKFRFWEAHDTVGIVCEKCGRAIWFFT